MDNPNVPPVKGHIVRDKKGNYQKIAEVIAYQFDTRTYIVRTVEGFELRIQEAVNGKWLEA